MKQFKAESKRLLDLMINSIYTNKEIFLRELISNASDAIDKRRFESLTDSSLKADFEITLSADKDNKILTITDNGCGMDEKTLESNLGTIAKSGTLDFKSANKTDESLIGQFGVGFYSAFMVSTDITVISRATGSTQAYKWESKGADGYVISQAERECAGTTIILTLKENDDDYSYADLSEEHKLKSLVKKYSDYIRYPIKMNGETLNSMIPLWKKPKSQVKTEHYETFYKDTFHDYMSPIKTISANVEGNLTYNALLFVPGKAPYDYFSKDYAKGLKLFSGGVLIMDKCADLLPDYLGFVKGLVDSADLSLNISRELLQKDRQLRAIAVSLEKKIVSEFKKWITADRDGYLKMYEQFGSSIKMGAYDNFGAKKDELKDLIMFKTSVDGKLSTFKEYVGRMKEGQTDILYACGATVDSIAKMPQTEKLLKDGYEIMYLTDNIDEFVIKIIEEYDGKKVKSAFSAMTETDSEQLKKDEEDSKDTLTRVVKALSGLVKQAKLTSNLISHAVYLGSEGEISLEMERVLNAMPGGGGVKADRILYFNPKHPQFDKLSALKDEDKFNKLAKLLYNVALLQENLPVDTGALAQLIVEHL